MSLALAQADRFKVLKEYPLPEPKDGGSMHGLAV
jgi:hypothetical protein